MSAQTFERLIRLEDEELENNEDSMAMGDDDDGVPDRDSCKIRMISNGNQADIDNKSINHDRSRHSRAPIGGGFHFVINGRHIRMNPEQLKYISLITLTVQNAALNLTMRAARTQTEQFSTSVAVTVAEFLKLITCIVIIWYEEVSFNGAIKAIRSNIIDNYKDTLKVALPSFVYYVQNNLLYLGSTHLDAATCQITYQLKILTTAVFSVLMLNKKLNRIQWAALVILFLGVAMIETIVVTDHTNKHNSHSNLHNGTSNFAHDDGGDATSTLRTNQEAKGRNERPLVGFFAILIACCLSGFAGVYFEKILKNTSHVSLWIRNIQLAVVAIPFGLFQVVVVEFEHFTTKGPFYGFTPLTWLCILLQVQGGLLVAVVVKFANNILKGFATSMAIVISTVASMFLFDFNLTPTFVFGATLVIGSVMMYNKQ